MYTIKKGCPPVKQKTKKYPFSDLNTGEYFSVPIQNYSERATAQRRVGTAGYLWIKYHGLKGKVVFSCRLEHLASNVAEVRLYRVG